ncbi:ABC-2 type transport system permease protein [Saccharothrix tamanrassetensis]|uniref:ABC-2 type transport system permease protein n=1 Tax=Saccharothrix tamanrassetensis TaxID=1051531 RepID=A0A841CY17_9PSEU|nr:ABC transporter permease [Saccharothrix tamanrassetensis]MBB5960236.1 ABC-2 type transport system permease protein [Saccharothrix tamanrassetensis]
MITALGLAELKLLVRNRTAAALAFAMPLLFGAFFALSFGDEGWTFAITLQVLSTLGFTVYVTITTSLTSRRQDLYLKRLRTGAASDAVVLTGVVLPAVLLGLVQAVLLVGVSVAAGAQFPSRPDLLALALVGGAAMSCAAGVATSGVTSTAELAQITTGPFFFALLGGGIWAMSSDDIRALLVPGGGVADLVGAAWGGEGRPGWAALSLLAWTAVGCVLSARLFRWDARSQ